MPLSQDRAAPNAGSSAVGASAKKRSVVLGRDGDPSATAAPGHPSEALRSGHLRRGS